MATLHTDALDLGLGIRNRFLMWTYKIGVRVEKDTTNGTQEFTVVDLRTNKDIQSFDTCQEVKDFFYLELFWDSPY